MRKLVHRKRVRIADLSADDGVTWGVLARQAGERTADHLVRLTSGLGHGPDMGTVRTVMAYAGAMRAGDVFPPVFVIRAPSGMVLVDGTHRAMAAAFNSEAEIDAVVMRARSDADADAMIREFRLGEFEDGRYPSDQPEWGAARHVALRLRSHHGGGQAAAVARRHGNVSRSLARIAA